MKAFCRVLSMVSLLTVVFLCVYIGTGEAATSPAAPVLTTVSVVSSSQIDLVWQDVSNNESGFIIERQTGAGEFSGIGSVGANITAFIDIYTIPETTYTYRIQAFNNNGESYSNEMSVITMATPSALNAVGISATRVDLSWTDQTSHESWYQIERKTPGGSFSLIQIVNAGVVNYSDLSVSGGTSYFYRVRAVNTHGYSSYSNEASVSTMLSNPPAAPTNLSDTPVTKNSITLSWTDNANNEEGFIIERKVTGGNFAEVETVHANVTTYKNTGLAANTSSSSGSMGGKKPRPAFGENN